LLGASNFKFIDLTFQCFVENKIELLMSAMRTHLLLEPVLKTGATEVLSTALSEVRVTENLCADTAVEPVRD